MKKHSVIKSLLLSQSLVQSAFIRFEKQLTRLMVCGSVSDYLVSSLVGFAIAKIHLFCENKWFLNKSFHFFPHGFFLFSIFAVGLASTSSYILKEALCFILCWKT